MEQIKQIYRGYELVQNSQGSWDIFDRQRAHLTVAATEEGAMNKVDHHIRAVRAQATDH